jgi:hypothetical protein
MAYNRRISAVNMGMSSAGLHDLTRMILKRMEHDASLEPKVRLPANAYQGDCQQGQSDTTKVDLQLHFDPAAERVVHSATVPLGREEAKVDNSQSRRSVSAKKLRANRLNSLRSTGPRTPQGKQAVRQNAVTHGLLSHPVVVLSEKELDQFENWRSKLRSWIGPKNEAEERLVSNAAVLIWKLGRCIRVQGSLLSTSGSADRWRTLDRYAGSLNRQLREMICDLYILHNEKERAMSDEERKWDLRTDGELWKAAASAVDDPEFQKRCEIMVGGLQENLDRTDGLLLLVADSAAAAFIRKQQVLAYESAHTRIAAFNSREMVEKADPSIRESARIAAAFPSDDVLDRSIRFQSLCDRQIQKFMELLDRFWNRTEEQAPDVSRKPPQRAQDGKGEEPGVESTGTEGSHVAKKEN